MRKFYTMMLAMLCFASMAMALPSDNGGGRLPKTLTVKKQLREAKSIAKKEKPTGLVQNVKVASMKANMDKLQQLGGKKVLGMRKADANEATIEGTWTFTLGDWYFTNSTNGYITYNFNATIYGNQVVFEDPTNYEAPFVADYNITTGELTFKREYVASVTSGYIYQEPFVYNWDTDDLDLQTITATYNAATGTISFAEDNGISWPVYNSQVSEPTQEEGVLKGYWGIYDLVSATKATAGGDVEDDGEWENIGDAIMEDPWLIPGFGVDQHSATYQWTVPLQRNVENHNLYRLVDPYHKGPLASVNSSTKVGYITFDATDPNHVIFLPTEAGFANSSAGISQFYCMNMLGMYVAMGYTADLVISIMGDEIPYTKFADNKITFGTITDEDGEIVYDANFGIQGRTYGGYSWTDNANNHLDMTGSITFPTLGGDDDTDTPTVDNIYYQLNREDNTAQVTGCVDFLTALNIPETIEVTSGTYTVTSVAKEAFYGNKTITSVTIPATITDIYLDAFRNTSNLRTLNIDDLKAWIAINFENGNANPLYNVFPTSTSQWGKVYIAGEEVSDLVIPEGVTYIGRSFYGFKALKSVTLPSTLVKIEAQAFNACEGLTEVTLPAALESIGNMAFYGAKNIEAFTCYAAVPPTCGYMNFDNFSAKATLYVPEASVEAYKAAPYWEDFTNIVGVEVPEGDFGDASIEGEWNFTLDWHYAGSYSLGVQTEVYTATLDGNTVTFESQYGEKFVAKFTAENTLTFGIAAVGDPATYTRTQNPFTDGTNVTDAGIDPENFVFESFTAEFNPEAGTITFPEGSGLAFGNASAAGEFSYYEDAFDFIAATKVGSEPSYETVGTYTLTILPTNIYGEKNGEKVDIEIEVRKSGDSYSIVELGTTNYFNDQIVPFAYNEDTEMATFTAGYAGEFGGNPVWFSAFVYNGEFAEPQETYAVKFNTETGFEFPGNSGFGWFVTSSADTFDAQDVYSVFYISPKDDETGIKAVDANVDAIYYDLNGRRVIAPKAGLYIKKTGNKVQKVVIE